MPTHSHAFPFDYDLISDWNLKDRQNEAVKMREDQDRFVRNVKAIYSNPAGCLETHKSCQKRIDDMFEGSGEDSMGNFARALMPQLQGENWWDKMPAVPSVDSERWKEEQWQRFFVNLVKNIARLLMYGTPMQLFDLESEAVSDEQRLRDYVAEIKSSTASHLRMHGNQRFMATLIAEVPILYAASSVAWREQAAQLQIQGWNMDGAGAYATTLAQIGTFAMSAGALAIAAATNNKANK
jgi:hypothetical protein